jgi:hypothetical protein
MQISSLISLQHPTTLKMELLTVAGGSPDKLLSSSSCSRSFSSWATCYGEKSNMLLVIACTCTVEALVQVQIHKKGKLSSHLLGYLLWRAEAPQRPANCTGAVGDSHRPSIAMQNQGRVGDERGASPEAPAVVLSHMHGPEPSLQILSQQSLLAVCLTPSPPVHQLKTKTTFKCENICQTFKFLSFKKLDGQRRVPLICTMQRHTRSLYRCGALLSSRTIKSTIFHKEGTWAPWGPTHLHQAEGHPVPVKLWSGAEQSRNQKYNVVIEELHFLDVEKALNDRKTLPQLCEDLDVLFTEIWLHQPARACDRHHRTVIEHMSHKCKTCKRSISQNCVRPPS